MRVNIKKLAIVFKPAMFDLESELTISHPLSTIFFLSPAFRRCKSKFRRINSLLRMNERINSISTTSLKLIYFSFRVCKNDVLTSQHVSLALFNGIVVVHWVLKTQDCLRWHRVLYSSERVCRNEWHSNHLQVMNLHNNVTLQCSIKVEDMPLAFDYPNYLYVLRYFI